VKDTGALDMRAIGIVESGGKHLMLTAALLPRPPVLRLCQLMPDTGKELAAKRGVEYNPADEQQNAILASDYANQLTVNMALKLWPVPHITGVWVTLTN
jgi:hypothetical protein